MSQAVEAGGQDRLGATGVRLARVALDQPVEDQPVDESRHAALAEDHPDRPAGACGSALRRICDGQQGVVLGERQVVFDTQLFVEPARDPGVRLEECAPRLDPLVARRKGRASARSVTVMDSMLHLRRLGRIVDNATI